MAELNEPHRARRLPQNRAARRRGKRSSPGRGEVCGREEGGVGKREGGEGRPSLSGPLRLSASSPVHRGHPAVTPRSKRISRCVLSLAGSIGGERESRLVSAQTTTRRA